MKNLGAQKVGAAGSRFYFQRDPIASVVQPILDFGTIETANPAIDETTIELKDGDGGILRLVDETTIDIIETYDLTCFNIGPEMTALMFSSNPPVDIAQAAGAVTDIRHFAHPGRLVKLLDADYDAATPGAFIQGIASIQVVAGVGGTPIYVLDTDYQVVSLERGLIRMVAGGAFAAAAAIEIDYTKRAIENELRRILPATAANNVKGNGVLIWSGANNTQQIGRIARFSVTTSAPNFQIEDYSSLGLQLKVIHDLSAAEPAGKFDYWLGDLPAAS